MARSLDWSKCAQPRGKYTLTPKEEQQEREAWHEQHRVNKERRANGEVRAENNYYRKVAAGLGSKTFYTKLPDGGWGIQGIRLEPGTKVEVTKKNGEVNKVVVGPIVDRKPFNVCVCLIA